MYLLKLIKKQEMKLFASLTPPDLNIMSINVIYSGGNAQMEVNTVFSCGTVSCAVQGSSHKISKPSV